MADKSDLKAELERKKQRLAEIREEKKRKEEERKKRDVRSQSETRQKSEAVSEASDLDHKRRETEALLQSIGISPEPPLVPTLVSPPSKPGSTASEVGSQDSTEGAVPGRYRTLHWDTDPSVPQLQSDPEFGPRMQRLGPSKITQVDFQPRELVTYSKETQTPLAVLQSEEEDEDEEISEPAPELEPEPREEERKQEAKEAPPRELTEEEKLQMLHSDDFLIFFDCSIRVMERALAEDSDIFFDYSGRDLDDKEG